MVDLKLRMISIFALCLVIVVAIPFPSGYTCEEDVYAISSLHAALGHPLLPGWTPFGGDPCLQGWQGVQCVGPNITAIVINDANLGGELGDMLGNFTSIITLDFSNNHIGGSIPTNLPVTLRQFFLSSNQLTGRIPSSLADLTLLSDMSLNENSLNGELPDAFQSLTGLVNLDVSSNNLNGPLPPSITSLSSLTTLHIQDNHISGTLDVLQDLPLMDLDIENNLFSGPVPEKLWNIPNFKSNGNPFNTTVAPEPAPIQAFPSLVAPVPSPYSDAPVRHGAPTHHGGTSSTVRKNSTMRVIAYVVAVVLVIIAVLLALFCTLKLQERHLKRELIPKCHKKRAPKMTKQPLSTTGLVASNYKKEDFYGNTLGKQNEHEAHMIETSAGLRPIMAEKVAAKPIAPLYKEKDYISFDKAMPLKRNCTLPASVTSFSVASLQQYTNYFGEENLIRSSYLGRVYMAELSEGKLLTVLKLNNLTSNINTDDFHELVLRISELQHQNIIKLEGYCSEFGQRLLIFKYFSRTTLNDLLYDFSKKRLSWNARIQIALAAARAIEYLHESCKPPVILRNLEASSILLDDEHELAFFMVIQEHLLVMRPQKISELQGSCLYRSNSQVSCQKQYLVSGPVTRLMTINALSRIVDPSIDGWFPLKSLSRFAGYHQSCVF
ncbi:protein STRUBBELIG-RECEPTOR FAMILY 3, partial [Dendrobium catenatum]|uniref:protein STRUBBELIG-RECEPTOR FAMILY 3 n=1 Tax=Dendrobium catenatum TaxID=906689 RepID=UPI0010A09A66